MFKSIKRITPIDPWVCIAFLLVAVFSVLLTIKTGASFVWPDSLDYAGKLKGLLPDSESLPPLYSFLLQIVAVDPDVESGHAILVALQALLLASAVFPLRALLGRHGGLATYQAGLVAMAIILSPVLLAYTPLVTPDALFISLLVFFTWFIDRVISEEKPLQPAICAGITAGLMLLTLESGWIVWVASTLTLLLDIPKKRREGKNVLSFLCITFIPLAIYGLWALVAQNPHLPEFHGNNPLARFNFIKNGLLYALYAGPPVVGLAFILGAAFKGRLFWQDAFFRFAAFCIIGLLFYVAFSTGVIVDRKLDYFSNRALDPFLFLPAIVFFRMTAPMQKEALVNGLMVFFVLFVLGLPHGLNLDFKSGLTYWAESMPNERYGLIRNIIYLVLIVLPAIIIYFRPAWFPVGYAVIALLFAGFGGYANSLWWHKNEDSNIAFLQAKEVLQKDALQTDYATDYDCRPAQNNDPAHMFLCLDTAKLLYFMPGKPRFMSASAMREEGQGLFISSENDALIGEVIASHGLARLVQVTPESAAKSKAMPLAVIKRMDGLSRYTFLRLNGRMVRAGVINPESAFRIVSPAKGCVILDMNLAKDETDRKIRYRLDAMPEQTVTVPPMHYEKPVTATRLRLMLPEGESSLHISYGKPQSVMFMNMPSQTPSLILFGRPAFVPCN